MCRATQLGFCGPRKPAPQLVERATMLVAAPAAPVVVAYVNVFVAPGVRVAFDHVNVQTLEVVWAVVPVPVRGLSFAPDGTTALLQWSPDVTLNVTEKLLHVETPVFLTAIAPCLVVAEYVFFVVLEVQLTAVSASGSSSLEANDSGEDSGEPPQPGASKKTAAAHAASTRAPETTSRMGITSSSLAAPLSRTQRPSRLTGNGEFTKRRLFSHVCFRFEL